MSRDMADAGRSCHSDAIQPYWVYLCPRQYQTQTLWPSIGAAKDGAYSVVTTLDLPLEDQVDDSPYCANPPAGDAGGGAFSMLEVMLLVMVWRSTPAGRNE